MFGFSDIKATSQEVAALSGAPCKIKVLAPKNQRKEYKGWVSYNKYSNKLDIEHQHGISRRKLADLNVTYEVYPWVNTKMAIDEDTKRILTRRSMCFECESEHCIYNPEGICRYPLVTGQKRCEFWSEDECKGFTPNDMG